MKTYTLEEIRARALRRNPNTYETKYGEIVREHRGKLQILRYNNLETHTYAGLEDGTQGYDPLGMALRHDVTTATGWYWEACI
ncbi:MAG: hypothetical protein LBQ80_04090 [Clostridium sp.]|jgi:hypothetical protein|nr:hypothetical protein [Clostridium sp.]